MVGVALCLRHVADAPLLQRRRKAKHEIMMYQISYGPPGSRLVESTENIGFAADRYCDLANKNAPNIELSVEGMPLDPLALLKACPASRNSFLPATARRPS